jgi:hypothetical protein
MPRKQSITQHTITNLEHNDVWIAVWRQSENVCAWKHLSNSVHLEYHNNHSFKQTRTVKRGINSTRAHGQTDSQPKNQKESLRHLLTHIWVKGTVVDGSTADHILDWVLDCVHPLTVAGNIVTKCSNKAKKDTNSITRRKQTIKNRKDSQTNHMLVEKTTICSDLCIRHRLYADGLDV